jgi:NADH:ubiquinone oxidoreductase subunit 4 (subunit M)
VMFGLKFKSIKIFWQGYKSLDFLVFIYFYEKLLVFLYIKVCLWVGEKPRQLYHYY